MKKLKPSDHEMYPLVLRLKLLMPIPISLWHCHLVISLNTETCSPIQFNGTLILSHKDSKTSHTLSICHTSELNSSYIEDDQVRLYLEFNILMKIRKYKHMFVLLCLWIYQFIQKQGYFMIAFIFSCLCTALPVLYMISKLSRICECVCVYIIN